MHLKNYFLSMNRVHNFARLRKLHIPATANLNVECIPPDRPKKGDRVFVAMSGGVDSSVAARLLVDQSYDLSAIFMRNWDTRDEYGEDQGCEWEKDWEDVQRVCRLLDLPCEMIDLSKDYWNMVFEPSLRLWEAGQTPNPDIWCNREIKFGALLNRIIKSGGQFLATGHYSCVDWGIFEKKSRPMLVRASDRHKDQSYYLSALREEQLRQTIFPLHNLSKENVRKLAATYKLPTALRPESMGICFVGQKRRFNDFLTNYLTESSGPIVDLTTGSQIADHRGLWHYTIGQGARISGSTKKMFVARKDTKTNKIFVVPAGHPALDCQGIVVNTFHWIWSNVKFIPNYDQPGMLLNVQFRHKMMDIPAKVKQKNDGRLEITFVEPQIGVAPGQVAALYIGTWCLGSGIITETIARDA